MKIFTIRILFLISILLSSQAFAVDLAVMLFASDQKNSDLLYEENLKDLGFNRLCYRYKSDYHLSVGIIDDVEEWDVKDLTEYLINILEDRLKNDIFFEFGVSATLGKATPFLVAIPKNIDVFIDLNNLLSESIINYKHHKYKLQKFSLPGHYVPHISLNGQIYKEIHIDKLYSTMSVINKRLANKIIKIDKLVIR